MHASGEPEKNIIVLFFSKTCNTTINYNDSKKERGSRVDRHEHIGRGKIGLTGFRLLLNDPRFAGHPMVLETPKGKDLQEDIENLKVLRRLIKKE